MKKSYLEVTYRKGRPLAAYLYLPRRNGESSVRTETSDGGLVVDYAADGRPIGIEITTPSRFDLQALNDLLVSLGQPPIQSQDLAPLVAV